MPIEIDYSAIPSPATTQQTAWKAPRHVYFGPKDPNTGQMADEPVYVRTPGDPAQEFPRMLYKLDGEKITASLVNGEDELTKALSEGWKKSPADLGHYNAPSFEQAQAAKLKVKK